MIWRTPPFHLKPPPTRPPHSCLPAFKSTWTFNRRSSSHSAWTHAATGDAVRKVRETHLLRYKKRKNCLLYEWIDVTELFDIHYLVTSPFTIFPWTTFQFYFHFSFSPQRRFVFQTEILGKFVKIYFLFYSFVYLFIAQLSESVCSFIFYQEPIPDFV